MDRASTTTHETVEFVDGVYLTQLVAGDRMSVQHVRIEPGAVVPEHDHHHEQLGFVYQGVVTFVLADGVEETVEAGGSYCLAAGESHAVENRGDEDALVADVFSPPRPAPDWSD